MDDVEKSTLNIETIDLHQWEAEEEEVDREDERIRIKELVTKAVIANEGNPGMVNRVVKTGVTKTQMPCSIHMVYN